jgi:nucleotide-binding universal stress UspA family protein
MSSADRIHEDSAAAPDCPLLICYDGSADAKLAIEKAGGLARRQACAGRDGAAADRRPGELCWSGATASMVNFVELDHGRRGRLPRHSRGCAHRARGGLEAEPVAIKATGSVWETIIQTAAHHNAAAILMGSRGLTGVRSMLLGSVSSAVVQHAVRASLVIYRRNDEHAAPDQPT